MPVLTWSKPFWQSRLYRYLECPSPLTVQGSGLMEGTGLRGDAVTSPRTRARRSDERKKCRDSRSNLAVTIEI